MVQPANIYKISITDPFLDLSEHYQGPQKDNVIAKQAPNSPQSGLLSPEMIISWPIIPEWIILDYIWSI